MVLFNSPSWLKERQTRAQEKFLGAGLPTRRDESWRYTSLQEYSKIQFAARSTVSEPSALASNASAFRDGADYVLAFRNGQFISADSRTSQSDEVYVLPLSKVLMSSGAINERLRTVLEREPNVNLKAIGWQNSANFQEGAFIFIRAESKAPIKILIQNDYEGESGEDSATSVYPRSIFLFGARTQAEILEIHSLKGDSSLQANSACDYVLEAGAVVKGAQFVEGGESRFFFNDTNVTLEKDSDLQFAQITKGGQIVRHEGVFQLLEPGACLRWLGLALGSGRSHIDTSTYVLHQKGQTRSEQLMKTVGFDSSRAVFSGRLLIEKDAQKANARQHCHNLLASDEAEADARPQLEVRADDVKAAHGATTGQMREEELFYLQSRGLTKMEASVLLSHAYQNDVIGRLESEFLRRAAAHFCWGATQ
jgi:Fe-S cluster assembly protein SufD